MEIALATSSDVPKWEQDDKPLLQALKDLGVQVTCPVWDDPSVDWSSADAVLIRTTWDYWHKRPAFLEWADALEERLYNPPKVVRWNTHKSYLRAIAKEAIPIAPTIWLDRYQSVELSLVWPGWEGGFIKPQIGANAEGTLRFDADQMPRAQAFLDAALRRQDMMLQPYLESVELQGEVSAIFVDGVFCHAVRKVPDKGDYRVQDDHGASDAPYALSPDEQALCQRVMQVAMRMLGLEQPLLYGRVDLLWDLKGRPVLNELELVEPSLFFRHGPKTAQALAGAIVERVKQAAARKLAAEQLAAEELEAERLAATAAQEQA